MGVNMYYEHKRKFIENIESEQTGKIELVHKFCKSDMEEAKAVLDARLHKAESFASMNTYNANCVKALKESYFVNSKEVTEETIKEVEPYLSYELGVLKSDFVEYHTLRELAYAYIYFNIEQRSFIEVDQYLSLRKEKERLDTEQK